MCDAHLLSPQRHSPAVRPGGARPCCQPCGCLRSGAGLWNSGSRTSFPISHGHLLTPWAFSASCARPRQLFPSTSRPSPALGPSSPMPQADLPQRKGPGEGREGPFRSDRPERPKVHVDQGSEAALARALTLEKRPGRHLDAGASLPGLEPRLHYSLCVFGQVS